MNKILFKGENLSHKEGYKIFEQYTNGLEEIEGFNGSRETNDLTYVEFEKDKDTKIIVQAYYKNENFDIEYMEIIEARLPNAMDFNNIETLRDKYITNWNSIPKQVQNFILSCNKYWIDLQEVLLYKENEAIASMGVSRWYSNIEVISIGAGELFQWNQCKGFTANNLV